MFMHQALFVHTSEMLNNALSQHSSFEKVDDNRLEESLNEFHFEVLQFIGRGK